jgi:HupE / UreJ protein
VTAFTVAHSITLSLAALDIVRIPSAIIEPAIAASIIYVAAENFVSRDIDKRWRDTFGFGLIHGFAFASALQEFGLPRNALVPALALFNLGVEIGQIAIVSLLVPGPGSGSRPRRRPPSPSGLQHFSRDHRPRQLLVFLPYRAVSLNPNASPLTSGKNCAYIGASTRNDRCPSPPLRRAEAGSRLG